MSVREQYHSIIEQALRGEHANESLLQPIRADLDTILGCFDKSNSPTKAVIASTMAKLVNPTWDTRKHQTGIGGMFSLRSIDHSNICPYMYQNGYYPTATEFALTRSFEKAELYTKTYSGMISPAPCKPAFLNIVHCINESYSEQLCRAILCYCCSFLKERKAKQLALRSETIAVDVVQISTVKTLLHRIFTSSTSGISMVPVIAMWTACNTAQPVLWPAWSMVPLKEHTAADGNSNAFGDVEGTKGDAHFLACEVKHGIEIDPTITMTFEQKTRGIPLRYIITTKPRAWEISGTGCKIGTVTDAVCDILLQGLAHNDKIMADYVTALHAKILGYPNMSVVRQESINRVFTEVLAAAAP